jgi:ADP-ribose pyrophosphatase YjhB (NUDIX family)
MMQSSEKRNADGLTEKEFLANYRPGDYDRPSVTVDMLIFGMDKSLDNLKVLLIQRKNHPFIECFALAGGFVEINESADDAACRELLEETGLKNVYMEQLYTMSEPDRDPRMRVIDIAYVALMPVAEVTAGDDAKEALWFDVKLTQKELVFYNEEHNITMKYSLKKETSKNGVVKLVKYVPVLESEDALAFDHAEIVLKGLLRLRNKIEDSDIAFNLVPSKFKLSDLQKVYEAILGRKLKKADFNEKIAGKVKSIGEKNPELYKYTGCR